MEAPPLERRLVAILAADVEGYSRLMHQDESATMATLSARRAVIDELVAHHRGRIANTAGDSLLAEFASMLDAVVCALEIQAALAAANADEPEDRRMRFRIGVNVGDVMVKDGDLFGDGVNVAARLEGLVEGGDICVSRGVRDHLRHHSNLAFDDLGEQLVKNIAHPIRAFRVRACERSAQSDEAANGADSDFGLIEAEPVLSADSESALELAFWNSVEDGDAEELSAYLERYPEGAFAKLARKRLEDANDDKAGAEPTAPATPEIAAEAFDLAFWESVKDSEREEDFTAYLERHPDGHFASLARSRLAALASGGASSADEPVEVSQAELAFWESIQDGADPELFSAYLEKYPEGEFAVIARARLAGSGTR
jgi:class 3 adenylate cyclase